MAFVAFLAFVVYARLTRCIGKQPVIQEIGKQPQDSRDNCHLPRYYGKRFLALDNAGDLSGRVFRRQDEGHGEGIIGCHGRYDIAGANGYDG